MPTSIVKLNIFETCASSLFFLFHFTGISHSNAWPGTASNLNIYNHPYHPYPYLWLYFTFISVEVRVLSLPHFTLCNLSFVPRWFKCNFTLLKGFNIEYILIVRSRLEIDEKHGEW
jgi:hypothetical protein